MQRQLNKVPRSDGDAGFSLVEVAVALVILMIAMLGVVMAFGYAIRYNAGNYTRAQSLAIIKRESERIRSAKFTPSGTDPDLAGGVHADTVAQLADGSRFLITTTVDNDPYTGGVQDESVATSYKEITITARPEQAGATWRTAPSATVVLRRVKGN